MQRKHILPAVVVAVLAAAALAVFYFFADKTAERMVASAAATVKLQSGDDYARVDQVEHRRVDGVGDGYVCGNYRPSNYGYGRPRRFVFIDGGVKFFGDDYKSDRQIVQLCNSRY